MGSGIALNGNHAVVLAVEHGFLHAEDGTDSNTGFIAVVIGFLKPAKQVLGAVFLLGNAFVSVRLREHTSLRAKEQVSTHVR